MNRQVTAVLIGCTLPILMGAAGDTPEITFRQRVDAQRAIENVYQAHDAAAQDTARYPIPSAVLEARVRSYLEKSAALEAVWHVTITPQMLRAEVERMASQTRMPDRLREIYHALDDDPILIQECLARPALAQRLLREKFVSDPPDGTSPRPGATPVGWDRWWRAARDRFDGDTVPTVAEPMHLPEPAGSSASPLAGCSTEGVWAPVGFDNVPSPRYGAAVVWTGSQMIVWGGTDTNGPLGTGGRYDPVIDAWFPISDVDAPAARRYPLAVWTGDRMIVWGGYGQYTSDLFDTGGVYDPVTDTWAPTSLSGAPAGRMEATAVWTGTRMIVWGGYSSPTRLDTGAGYDPVSDTWSPVSTTGAPSPRSQHSAVWTGSRMIVWGGSTQSGLSDDGARYDPVMDTWEPMTSVDAPDARRQHAAVWSGTEMIVYGGTTTTTRVNTGARYRPATDDWAAISLDGAPAARYDPAVAWIDDALVVWGGSLVVGGETNDGYRYDPAMDSWSSLTAMGAPSSRRLPDAVWTGSRLLIWGGLDHGTVLADGGRYDPGGGSWTTIFSYPVKGFGQVWTGSLSISWSPYTGGGFTYDPATGTSTPISSMGAPPFLRDYTSIWTGSKMIVWGGSITDYPGAGMGGIYDPVTDSWTAISQMGAPVTREGHTAVWTGTRMIVWGGWYGSDYLALDDGYSFDPETNSWSPIAASGLMPRAYHSAVWTGTRMIIWGGVSGDIPLGYPTLNDGAAYYPATNTWSPISATNAPSDRYMHTAVWTGSRMIVWGGGVCSGGPYCSPLSDGASYSPPGDTWQALGTAGTPPPAMSGHTAVWTGSSMIVYDGPGQGGRYSPGSGSWMGVSSDAAPPATGHAIWTGSAMGVGDALFFPDVYADTDGDGWTPCDGDCNDARWDVHPGATEVCNGIDDDCDGIQDDGAALYCSDGDDCTSDVCGAARGCVNPVVPDGTACSDGDACTVADMCASGICAPGNARDDDADTHPDGLCGGDDCDDGDPTVWHEPDEVSGMTLEVTTPTPLSWDAQDLIAGPATTYDLFSGTLVASAALDFTSGTCLVAGGSAWYDDGRAAPAPGEVFWYLARARNDCGTATWGPPAADADIPACP